MKVANRFPDLYEDTWLKIFAARYLEVRLVVKRIMQSHSKTT